MLCRFLIILFAALSLFVAPSGAWAAAADGLEVFGAEVSAWPLIRLVVGPGGEGGGLAAPAAASFQATLDNQREAAVRRLLPRHEAGLASSVLVAVDTSGTMRGKPLAEVKKALGKLAGDKGPADAIGLIDFNDDVTVGTALTADTTQFMNAVDGLKTAGSVTVLYKALYKGLDVLDGPGVQGVRYFVVLSDGKDEGVGFTLDDAIGRATKMGVPIYAMGMHTKAERKYLDNMERLARLSGGEYVPVRSAGDLTQAWELISRRILQRHVVELDAGIPADGGVHTVALRYTGADGRVLVGRWEVTAPRAKQPEAPPVGAAAGAQVVRQGPAGGWQHVRDRLSSPVVWGAGGLAAVVLVLLAVLLARRARKTLPETGAAANTAAAFCPQCGMAVEGAGLTCPACGRVEGAHAASPGQGWVLRFTGDGRIIPLLTGNMTIGAYTDNRVVIDVDTVSGYHAELSGNGAEWMLKDLGSTNGTFVNGERVTEAVRVQSGDVLRFGGGVEAVLANMC